MDKNFWKSINKPIIGLAPMDGITDPAFRAVVDELGHPDVLYTEFVSADGLVRNPKRLLRTFTSHTTTTPLIGQLFGKDVIAMQEASAMLIEQTRVVGIDINMGCPNKRVANNGGGAGLIKTPQVAKQLIRTVKEVIKKSHTSIGMSVKTRIGYDEIVTSTWIPTLLEEKPDAISLHGRTLKQMYTGYAHWEEILIASNLAKQTNTVLLGNGDISSMKQANEYCKKYSPDGVLIGRASFGNPWVFKNFQPSYQDRINAARSHCKYFQKLMSDANPLALRKHIGWYFRGFPDASSIRTCVMKLSTIKDMLDFLSTLSYSG